MDPTPEIAYTADTKITLTIYHYVKPAPTCDPNKTPTPTNSPSGSPSVTGLPTGVPTADDADTHTDPAVGHEHAAALHAVTLSAAAG